MLYIIIAVIVLIIFAACVIARKNLPANRLLQDFPTVKKDILTVADVISFFRTPEIMKELQESKNLIPVATKEKKENGEVHIHLCIYDKDAVAIKQPLKLFIVSSLAPDLQSMFGSKEMVIFQ